MLFKLAFNKTIQGTLRVSATTVPGSDHVLSIHDNDRRSHACSNIRSSILAPSVL